MKLIKRNYEEGYHDNILYREAPDSQRNRARLAVLLEHKTSGQLLGIGCGEGGFLRAAEAHFAVQGVDISRSAIRKIRPHFGDRVQVLDVEQRPLPKAQFDVVAAFNVLEHLRRPDKVIAKIYAALLPGGVLVGSVPNNQKVVGGLITHLGNFFDRTHVSTLTPDTWQRMFHAAGFAEIRFFGEVNLGRNRCRYVTGRAWPWVGFNLMFVCTRP